MADFFNNQNTDEEEQQVNKTAVNRNDYFNETIENAKKKVEARHQNRDIYGVSLPDEVYQFLNENVIKDAIYPEEEAYKWGTAFKYSQAYGIPLQEAYANVDNFNKALWEDKGVQPYKNWFKSVTDMVVLGNNNCQIGDIGNKIIQATDRNDTEELALLMDQYNAIKAENETLQDSIPRNWAVQALQAGAQSAPFTGYSALAGLFGNFIAPAAGTALAGYTSAYLTAGQEYMDLIEQGATHDTAKKVAIVSGGIQGAIEVALGNVPEFMEAGARATGLTKAVKNTSGFKLGAKSVEKIVNDTSKRFHFGPGKRMLADFIVRYGKNMLEEGSEEVLQEIVSIFGQNFAAATDGYDIPEEDRRGFIESAKEAFKGGVMGAITLGFFPTAVNAAMTTANYVNMQEAAQNIQSEKMFTDEMMKERTDKDGNTYRMADIIPSMNDEDLKDQLHQVWENNAAERDANFANIRSTEEIKETSKAHEGYENAIEDEETGEEVHQDVYRENGKLYTNDVVADDGKTGSFRFGDASKKAKNGYGNIEYTMDEDSNTITINELSVAEHRKGLTAEFYDQFAQEHAGWNIVWDPKSDTATKEMLVENNPRGAEAELSYYTTSSVKDVETRKQLYNAAAKYTNVPKSKLNQFVAFTETISKAMGQSLTEMMNLAFNQDENGNLEIFGKSENAEGIINVLGRSFESNKAMPQQSLLGEEFYKTAKGVTLPKAYKSIIYVGQHGDVGTLCHEMLHAVTPFFSNEMKAEAERLLNKPMEKWGAAENEQLATWLEQYVLNGYTAKPEAKNFLQQLTNSLVQIVDYLKKHLGKTLSPEIAAFYDKMLAGNDQILKDAMDAIAQAEAEREDIAQTGPTTEVAAAEEKKVETPQEQTQLFKGEDVTTQEEAVQNTLDNSDIDVITAEEIEQLINDEEATNQEKIEGIQWAADADITAKDALFQLVESDYVKTIAKGYIARRLNKLQDIAEDMEEKAKQQLNYNERNTALKIKKATGWEKINGKWFFETNDSLKKFHLKDISNKTFLHYLKNEPHKLVQKTHDQEYLLKDIVDDKQLYSIMPSIGTYKVEFRNNSGLPLISIREKLIAINMDKMKAANGDFTEDGLKRIFAEATQYAIQQHLGYNTMQIMQDNFNVYKALELASAITNNEKYYNAIGIPQFRLDPIINAIKALNTNELARQARIVGQRALKGEGIFDSLAGEEVDHRGARRIRLMQDIVNKYVYGITEEELSRVYFSEEGTERYNTAMEYLETFPEIERKRIKSNLEKYGDTSWGKQAIVSLNARKDMQDLMAGKEIPEDSILLNTTVKKAYEAIKGGTEGIFKYLSNSKTPFIGSAAKPVNAISSSLLNCNPSKECAQYCYATKGNYIYAAPIVKSEMVTWAVEHDPKRAAEIASSQYKGMPEYIFGQAALRIFDKGDISERWLEFIEEMNRRGVRLQIFSKRPELLRKVDRKMNVVLLSIDKSNTELAEQNPDLPIAYVYSGSQDTPFLEANKERYQKYSGVVLPVRLNNRILSPEELKAIPRWAAANTCPIDNGTKKIGIGENEWNCTKCDKYGRGCFYHRSVVNDKKPVNNLLELDKNTLEDSYEDIKRLAEAAGIFGEDQLRRLYDIVDGVRAKTLAHDDVGTEDGSITSFEETTGSRRRTGTVGPLLQTAYHGSAANFDKFNVEQYGLSGEGSMSFGYGTYVTGSEEIARDYAERQYNQKFDLTSKKSRAEQLTERIASDEKKLKTLETPEAFFKEKEDSIDDLKNEIELLKAAGKSVEFTENLIKGIDDIYTEENRVMQLKGITASIEQDKKELEEVNKQIKEIEALGDNAKHHLYTVDIPDNGFIKWDKTVPKSTRTRIVNELYSVLIQGDYAGAERELRYELLPMINTALTGKEIYQDIWTYLGSDKEASQFLNKLGYNGIDYPAGTNFGTPNGEEARNFVIFNDEDAQIIDHALFQDKGGSVAAAFNADIKDMYGDKYLKAPNGNPTKLTEEQWLQVRTPEFKNFFGDWENDPANASKVVDENGEPLVVYHGTREQFEQFDFSKLGKGEHREKGFYFVSNKAAAEHHGRYITLNTEGVLNSKIFDNLYKDAKALATEDIKFLISYDYKWNSLGRLEYSNEVYKNGIEYFQEIEALIANAKNGTGNIDKALSKIMEVFSNADRNNYNKYYARYKRLRKQFDITKSGVMEVFLNIRNPSTDPKYNPRTHGSNNDGVILKNVNYSPAANAQSYFTDMYIVSKDEAQIKSATDNSGTFNPLNANIFFQTMDDLYNDARSFETWQDFMDAYEMEQAFNIDDDQRFNQVPETADAQWYQSTWEMAKGLKTEESLNKEEVAEQYARDPQEQQALDAMFTTSMDSDPAMLNDFLIRVAEIEAVDLEGPEWQNVADEEDAAERKRIELLQDFIGTQLTHGNWLSNAQRVRGGEELTQGARNRILGLMRSNPRAYRAIYAELMEDPSYAVPEDETMGKQLAGKLKRYKLVSPDEDIERINPERLKKLSDQIDNIEIAQKLKNGTLPMNNDLDNYLKSLRKQIRDAEKQYNELEKETQSDYQRIADAEARDLLRLHDKLLKAKADYDKESDWIAKQINKGLKISRKYNQKAQNLKANYDEIFRKYKDLEAVIRIDATVEQALKRQNDVYKFKHEISKKKEEADAVAETKKLRTQLVKRVLRRVPFDRIDYDYARKVIAIQRMVEPNIMGGVNRWIGTEGPYLRGVVAGVLTDEAYKNQILRYLNAQRQTKTLVEFIDKLEELKSMDEFEAWWNSWTLKQRKAAAKFLPKEDWIRDLNLEALAKEREESIDLPIEMVETEGQLEDEDGNKLVDKKTGEPIMGPVWELKASQDIKDEVEEAVGPVIFNNILNRPFAEWTTDEMIDLAKVINDLYKEGRDELKAKLQQKKEAAAEIRRAIEKAVKNTGIVINDDDDDETKKRKQDKINKILGLDNPNLKGTEAGKDKGFMAKVNRLLHGYADANVRRVARLLDNQGEGVNTNMLYWKENEAYNAKQKSINERANKITQYMKDHNIDIDELAKTVTVDGREYTVDELLYFKAAAQDFAVNKDGKKKGQEDYYAPTSKNAVMFGNMFSSRQDMEQKSIWEALNKDMQDRIDNELLTDEEKALQRIGELDTTPGTTAYIYECIQRFNKVINAANQLDPKFQGLLDLIQKDYAEQYDRMNKISIEEFNSPVHRVKAYVPLVRLESNGDTNANQVKEDLLATMGGGSEKQAVNKGMTQRRTSQGPLHQKPVQTGIYKTWSNSVERTEHFIAYAPYVRELNRVYKSRDAEYTRRFIESRYGKGMIKYVDDYINEVANPNANKVRNAGDDILRTLRGKTAPAYLAWKASAIIKQGATSPWPYMQFVNPAEYLAASWKCIASRGAMYDAIRQKSVFMAQRVMDPMNDLIDEMAETAMNKWDRGISNFNKKGMAGLEWIDWVCVAPGWLACYEKKYAEVTAQNEQTYRTTKARLQEENAMIDFNSPQYMSQEKIEELAQKAMVDVEKAAVDYADDCTRLCQPSSRSVDISPLFKNSGEAMKAYLQFQTSLNVIWQNLRYDIPYYVANMKKDNIPPAIKKQMFMRITGTILGYTLAGIFMNSIMEGYSNGDDDDNKMQALREAIYYGVTQFTDSIPMIGSAVSNTAEKVITGKSGFISNNTDMTPMVSKSLDIFVQASKGNWLKAAEKTGEGFAMSLGLPVSGTKEILKEAGIDIGDADFTPGVELNEVYGILNNVIPQEDK